MLLALYILGEILKIVQSLGFFRGRSTFTVDRYDSLNLSIHSLTRKSEYKFPLDQIDHRYEKHKEFSFKALAALVFFTFLAIYFLWSGWVEHRQLSDVAGVQLFFGFIFVLCAIVAGDKVLKSNVNIVGFNDHSGRRIFNINGVKPSPQEVQGFCDALAKKISSIRYDGEISTSRMKEIYLKHLEFLLEHEVILESEFSDVLKRLNENKKIVRMVKQENV